MSAPSAGPQGYGRGARLLSIGIASTGLVSFAYFALASHVLDETDDNPVALRRLALVAPPTRPPPAEVLLTNQP